MAIYPLVIGAVAIIASIIGALSVRTTDRQRRGRRSTGAWSSPAVLSAAAFYPITKWLMDDLSFKAARPRAARCRASPTCGCAA